MHGIASEVTVNRLVAGSNPARGASSFKNLRTIFRVLCPQTAGARHSIFQASNRVRRELEPQRGASIPSQEVFLLPAAVKPSLAVRRVRLR